MQSRTKLHLIILILISLAIVSCAPAESTTSTYGFFYGLLHGCILPFAVIAKIFNMEVGIYALNNSGVGYWIGFLIGIGTFGKGGSEAYRKGRGRGK